MLSAARPDLPRALQSIITRAIERSPAARFQSVSELQRALRDTPQAKEEIRSGMAAYQPA